MTTLRNASLWAIAMCIVILHETRGQHEDWKTNTGGINMEPLTAMVRQAGLYLSTGQQYAQIWAFENLHAKAALHVTDGISAAAGLVDTLKDFASCSTHLFTILWAMLSLLDACMSALVSPGYVFTAKFLCTIIYLRFVSLIFSTCAAVVRFFF